ncbi:20328_t:CDS:2 [Cetraspora pellucida]|uniref:20328_t:CDS:1 n=1 Tax=Cetraspora pellucida TaxID=1433469 RepID=A0A9N9FJT9_9GLOM|nr:20328_t:CDS:2 [Cetraspora pellucida]
MQLDQNASDIIVLNLYIIEQIRDANLYNTKHKQLVSKKVIYANRFGKLKKALNLVLNLGCVKELMNMVTQFIDQKKSKHKNLNNKSSQHKQKVIVDPLVTKCCGHSLTK